MDLPALIDFHCVVRHGGFGRASRSTGRPKATLSRKVSDLERSLGVRLIDRGTRTLRLTDEGRALYERTQGPLGEIAEAEEAVASGASIPRGRLRVSAPIVLAHVLLPAIAVAFAAAYPEVELEIVAEDRKVDPVEDGYDLVLRVDPDPGERLIGRRFLEDQRVLVAPPGLTVPLSPSEWEPMAEIPAVAYRAPSADVVWQVKTDGGLRWVRPNARLRFSSYLMVRDAVLAGGGIALVPKLLVKDDLASGRLVAWGEADGPAVEIWALQNSRRLASTKVRVFLAALSTMR